MIETESGFILLQDALMELQQGFNTTRVPTMYVPLSRFAPNSTDQEGRTAPYLGTNATVVRVA